MKLVLASASPRRRQLLSRFDIPFVVEPSAAEERPPHAGESPQKYARELARHKARVVAGLHSDSVVLAADTVVAVDRFLLGKPENDTEARRMLERLRGRDHLVVTGVAVHCGGAEYAGWEGATVRMRNFSDTQLDEYIATGEPRDKAGAYAVQGLGGALIESVEGCLETVIGLPLCLTGRLLSSCTLQILVGDDCCHHFGADRPFSASWATT